MNPVYVYGTSTAPAQKPASTLDLAWQTAAVGPLMVWGGLALRKENSLAGTALVALGGARVLLGALSLLSAKR
jgi:hypothetical protein